MAEGKYKYELSDVEVKDRGQRLALVHREIELHRETLKSNSADLNAKIKALKKEGWYLVLAINEGYEWREVAEQQEMRLLLAECSICYHQQRFTVGTDLTEKLCDNCRTMGSMQPKDGAAGAAGDETEDE
jgi:RNase P subunit RPR2